MSDQTDVAISLAPTVNLLAPFVVQAAAALITAGVGWIALIVHRRWGIDFTKQQKDEFQHLVDVEAQAAVAAAEGNLGSKSITVDNKVVVDGAKYIQSKAPQLIADLGITPETVAKEVQAAIGKLQSNATTVPVVTAARPTL